VVGRRTTDRGRLALVFVAGRGSRGRKASGEVREVREERVK
jgi:hypothetical protein